MTNRQRTRNVLAAKHSQFVSKNSYKDFSNKTTIVVSPWQNEKQTGTSNPGSNG